MNNTYHKHYEDIILLSLLALFCELTDSGQVNI